MQHVQEKTVPQVKYRGSQSFALQCNLIRHFWRYTGEKPFQCNMCKKKLYFKKNMEDHRLMFTREKLLGGLVMIKINLLIFYTQVISCYIAHLCCLWKKYDQSDFFGHNHKTVWKFKWFWCMGKDEDCSCLFRAVRISWFCDTIISSISSKVVEVWTSISCLVFWCSVLS